MQQYPGTFIVLEGSDGSGKTTQLKLLAERLKAVGHEVEIFDFPRYDQPSSHFVRRYLNGDYGPAAEVSPYSAAMFYALDRYEAAPEINKALKAGKIVLSNRYSGSNMAHQGSKFSSEAEQRGFFIWADSLEFQLLGIPRPNLNIFLRVPAEVSFKLIGQKSKRSYTDKSHDEHEANIDHLTRTVATYDTLCRLFPKDFVAIECTSGGQLMSVPAISDLIWQTIQPLLPSRPKHKARGGVARFGPEKPSVEPAESRKLSLLALIEIAKVDKTGFGALRLDWLEPNSSYSFYTLPRLDEKIRERYLSGMQRLVKLHQQMRHKLLKFPGADAETVLASVIPLAAYASLELPKQSLAEAAKQSKLAELSAHSTQPSAKGNLAGRSDLGNLAREKLPGNITLDLEPLSLLETWPRNEFEILSDGLYGFSDLPRQDVQAAVEGWTYEQKLQAMDKLLKAGDPAVVAQVHYRWDVIADQKLLLELLRAGLAQNLRLQAPTPRYGYDTPEDLAEMGLEDDYLSCFDQSLELYSSLQDAKYGALASYAVLTGHRVRFEFISELGSLMSTTNADSLPLKAFTRSLIEKIAEVHPLIGAYLTKMAAGPAATSPSNRPKRRRRRAK